MACWLDCPVSQPFNYGLKTKVEISPLYIGMVQVGKHHPHI